MSITQHHTEWLSLIEISGPFLSLPVLNRTFPQGLETVAPELRQNLRAAYEEWLDNQGGVRADPALHRAWVAWVLTDLLEMDAEVLRRNEVFDKNLVSAAIKPFTLTVPEHGETLQPDFVIVNPSPSPLGEGRGGGSGGEGRLLVMVVPPGQDLEKPLKGHRWAASPATRMMLLLHGVNVRLGLVTNGEQWMIVDAPPGGTTGLISWYAELWLDEPLTLQAFVTLFNAGRFFGVVADATSEALLAASAADQQEVTDQLGYQVRHAVELLVQAIDLADRDHQGALLAGVSAAELYEAAVVVMMRLVFLLTAEERGLLLLGDALYNEHYALSMLQAQLRSLADQQGEELLAFRHDAWQRLLALFRGVHGGIRHDRLQLPAYGGDLFDPNRYPFLEGRGAHAAPSPWGGPGWGLPAQGEGRGGGLAISNRTVLHLLEALQFLQVKVGNERQARRLSFRALDVEQIGMVYEGLLDHTVKRAAEPVIGLSGTRAKEPELPLSTLEALLDPAARRGAGPIPATPRLLEFLKEETGRSASALQKTLAAPPPDFHAAEQLRIACDNDEALYQRVLPWHGLIRNDDYGRRVIIPAGRCYVTSGAARRSSGAHYTPRSLGEPLVQHTLEPLVYSGPAAGQPRAQWQLRPPAELLDLKICDMAMGSGALLVQTCRYLADRLVEAWDMPPHPNPPQGEGTKLFGERTKLPPQGEGRGGVDLPLDPAERLIFARRLIAQRCLYGVDKNPLAVEMAKLSLWLITLDRGKPFTFVDHALRCGDSLIGVDLEQLKGWSLEPTGERQFGTISLELDIQRMITLRREIEAMPVLDVYDQAAKRHKLAEAQAIANNLTTAADDLIASYYNTLGKAEQATLRTALLTVHRQGASLEEKWRKLATLDDLKPFHWPLEFPEVFLAEGRRGFDGFVGNPPFLGGTRISTEYGTKYLNFINSQYKSFHSRADLSALFFIRAFNYLNRGGAFGLIATNTIAQGDTKEAALDYIVGNEGVIYRALNSIAWPGAAAVVVSIVHIYKGKYRGQHVLDGKSVTQISAFLNDSIAVGKPARLAANAQFHFQGSKLDGIGFVLDEAEALAMLKANPQNAKVIKPYLNGQDLNSSPDQSPSRWVINFLDMTEQEAQQYPECFQIVKERVYPERQKHSEKRTREHWWQFQRTRPELYETVAPMRQVLVVALTSRTCAFAFLDTGIVFSHATGVIAFDDWWALALMQSSFHVEWAWQYGSSLKGDLRYTPSDIFETFPFPSTGKSLEPIGETYHEHRRQIMLARQEGLTKTYNRFHDPAETASDIARLRALHGEMDHAVAAAYGWSDLALDHAFHETAQGLRYTISESARREVLTRLLALNHARHAAEVAAGLHEKGSARKSAKPPKTTQSPPEEAHGQLDLFNQP